MMDCPLVSGQVGLQPAKMAPTMDGFTVQEKRMGAVKESRQIFFAKSPGFR
jgi:hypothetical protein